MTAVRKLAIASALIATGLGVAYFLGEPSEFPRAFQSGGLPPSNSARTAGLTAPNLGASLAPARAQLLPDTGQPGANAPVPEPPPLITSLAPIAPTIDTTGLRGVRPTTSSVEYVDLQPYSDGLPAARLRNEAPRALGNEPRSLAVIRRMPPIENLATDNEFGSGNSVGADSAGIDSSPQTTIPAGYSSETNGAAAEVASYNEPASRTTQRVVGPPPWSANTAQEEPRMHVVIDGDSLEKLAGRYLEDPRRSGEIFELNREVLASPDLLPIGVELKLPPRLARSSWNQPGIEPAAVNDVTIRAATRNNLVPIRATTPNDPYQASKPHALLASPIAVD